MVNIYQYQCILSYLIKFGDYHSYPPVAERIKKQHPVTAIKFPDDDKIREEKTE